MSFRKFERVTKKKLPKSPGLPKKPNLQQILVNSSKIQKSLIEETQTYDEFKDWLYFDRDQMIYSKNKDDLSSIMENVDEVTQFTGEACSKQQKDIETQSFGFSEAFESSTQGVIEPKQIVDDVIESKQKLIEDQLLEAKMNELGYSYKKTEYNCHKQHHNNPETINKLNSLLQGYDFTKD